MTVVEVKVEAAMVAVETVVAEMVAVETVLVSAGGVERAEVRAEADLVAAARVMRTQSRRAPRRG